MQTESGDKSAKGWQTQKAKAGPQSWQHTPVFHAIPLGMCNLWPA